MSSNDLANALNFARENDLNIHSLTIVRNGFLVLDARFYPFPRETRHDLASATKSVVSMLVGIATSDGYFEGVEQPVISALDTEPDIDSDSVSRIRIGDLLSMRSGFDCGFRRGEPELIEMRNAGDWAAHALRLPIITQPGTRYGYCSSNYHLLSAAISSATGESTLRFAQERLFAPLGIEDVYWPADPAGINHGWGDLQLRPRDMAKLGLLMLRRGRWEGRQIIPVAWIESSITTRVPVDGDEDYGLGWWLARGEPAYFEANGRGGQRITVVPEMNLVVVMTGGGFEPGEIGAFILQALRADSALPVDRAAQRRLTDNLRRIAEPPSRTPLTETETAGRISGNVYNLDENALGIQSIAIEFSDPDIAELRLRMTTGEALTQPLGLDGRYRTVFVQDGAISAGRGEWLDDGRFRIELNRLSLINRYVFDIEFDDRRIEIEAFEPTELGRASLRGRSPP